MSAGFRQGWQPVSNVEQSFYATQWWFKQTTFYNTIVHPLIYENIGKQHGVLDLSKFLYKPFHVVYHIYTCAKGRKIKTFHNMQIVFQKLLGNTKSHFIKSKTKEYLGHCPYN